MNTINKYPGKIAMVIPTHLFGITQETRELYDYLKRTYPSIFVLQDCAHGFFCKGKNGDLVLKRAMGQFLG